MKRSRLKDGIMLFLFFFRIGFFTFGGGWGILAQMEQEFIDKRKIITNDDLVEMVAVGKSIPGIMITNISMLFGYQVAGTFGGICAVLGIVTPAILVLTGVTFIYDMMKDNYWCASALRGICCAVVPIIGSATINLGKTVFKKKSGLLICALAFPFCYFTSISNVVLVAAGAIIGLIWMEVDARASH